MKNDEIAKTLYEIASYLEMQEVAFKPYAYKKAALTLDTLELDVEKIYESGGVKALEKIPGVGKGIALKIEEYLKTGKIKYYEKLKRKLPARVKELIAIEGVGPKTVETLYTKLGIRTLENLGKAARLGKIRKLANFGEKSEKNILEGIAFLGKSKGRFLLGDILPIVEEIELKLKTLKEIEKISVCGSVRRMKETIGDVDFLVAIKENKKPAFVPSSAKALEGKKASAVPYEADSSQRRRAGKVMNFFVSLPGVVKVLAKGPTKSSIKTEEGLDIDLRVVPVKSYGSALQYFTGSKEHNIVTRKIAISKGFKLNEYGVFKGKKRIAGETEKGVYQFLGLAYIEPEIRENRGEIEAALREIQGKPGGLPRLIDYSDIRGDLHCHSKWDGGKNSIREMAQTALDLGYKYLGISDHTKFLRIEHGLDEKQLALQRKEIDKLNEDFEKKNIEFKILQGAETNILNDGSVDIKNKVLEKLDYVIAGVHSNLKMPKRKMTERIIRAIKNPNINIISHLTGRLLKKREECQIDFDKILRAAKEFGVILEINSQPMRLDLSDKNIRRCKDAGVRMVINTDSHHKSQMKHIELGVAQARRGWAEKKDIINSYSLKSLFEFFK